MGARVVDKKLVREAECNEVKVDSRVGPGQEVQHHLQVLAAVLKYFDATEVLGSLFGGPALC